MRSEAKRLGDGKCDRVCWRVEKSERGSLVRCSCEESALFLVLSSVMAAAAAVYGGTETQKACT